MLKNWEGRNLNNTVNLYNCTELQTKELSKDLIFISHANPEDNDFAIWLASQLNNAGYNVWLDENKFKGGNSMWDIIQSTIRNKAIKFIAVISSHSSKEGVKDEISYAVNIAKENNYNDFILPIRLQKVEIPIELNRKMYLDFSDNWQKGLLQLIEFLEEHKVPRTQIVSKSFDEFLKYKIVPLENKIELVASNLFSIKKLPENIYFTKS